MTQKAKLVDESPLIVLRSLAETVGLNESIVLQQIHFYINTKKTNQDTQTYREGYYWVYNTFQEWQKEFRFWSLRTVKAIFSKLEKLGLVISKKFGRFNGKHKKWYRIDYGILDQVISESVSHAESGVQDLHDQECKICTIKDANSAPSGVQELHDHLKDQRSLTKISYREREQTHAKTQIDNAMSESLPVAVEVTHSNSASTNQNSINLAIPNLWEKYSVAPIVPAKNSNQQIEDPFYPKATPWQPTSNPNTIDQGFAEFVFQKVVQKADYWRDKNATITDAKQWIVKARFKEERFDQCWLRWLEYQESLKPKSQLQRPPISPIPKYLQEPPPNLSWLQEQVEKAKKEGHPYARTTA